MEAKIEILKGGIQEKKGVLSLEKICINLILLCNFYLPLPKAQFSGIILYINPFIMLVLEVRMFQPDK